MFTRDECIIIHDVRGGSRKISSSFQGVLGRGTNHTSKILSLQSKEVPTDVYWVKVKVLTTLTLMCDHSPQHTNSNRRNVGTSAVVF